MHKNQDRNTDPIFRDIPSEVDIMQLRRRRGDALGIHTQRKDGKGACITLYNIKNRGIS
jgi:hypothetical protein